VNVCGLWVVGFSVPCFPVVYRWVGGVFGLFLWFGGVFMCSVWWPSLFLVGLLASRGFFMLVLCCGVIGGFFLAVAVMFGVGGGLGAWGGGGLFSGRSRCCISGSLGPCFC